MEITASKWFSELEMEDPAWNYLPHQISTLDYPIDDLDFDSFSSKIDPIFNPQTIPNLGSAIEFETSFERPKKQQKTNSFNSSTTDPTSSPHIISFEKWPTNVGSAYERQAPTKVAGGSFRTPSHAHEHVIAERKRREKLSQRFIALSAIVPGLKKMDKATILGEAIKYLKHMQDQVKALEEQAATKTMESVVFVKKSHVYTDDESSSSDANFDGWSDLSLPKIEARVSGKDVLIKIHCENRKGTVQKILTRLEKIHLNIINKSVLSFGNFTIDVTIVAKVEDEFSMTVKEVAQNIRETLV